MKAHVGGSGHRLASAFFVAGATLATGAFVLLALGSEFQIGWIGLYENLLDGLFVVGSAALVVAWSIRAGGAALRISLAIVATIVTLVAAEFAIRYIFRNVHSSADVRTYFAHRGGGPAVSINQLGFREREIGPKSPDRYRMAIVGDSLSWGQGIEERERFSNLLQGYLGPRFEVLNFGVPGNNLPEHLQVLERALRVSPDFILLQLYINDFETPEMERPAPHALLPWPAVDRWLLSSSALYDLLNDPWTHFQERMGLVESYAHYMERNLKDPASPNSREAFGMLRQFIERARAAGTVSGTVLFPNPGLLDDNYPFGYLHDRVREGCADERITCLDMRGPLSSYKNPLEMWVSRFDPHPNARVNVRAAQEIMARFGGQWRQ